MERLILFFLLLISTSFLSAQDTMRVTHCTAIAKNANVENIYIDDYNDKWVASQDGLYKLYSADNAQKASLDRDQFSLLRQKDGNAFLNLDKELLKNINLDNLTTTFYDQTLKDLWVGTVDSGLYQIKIATGKIERYHTGNSKLKSNKINAIHIDKWDRRWVATDVGIWYKNGSKESLYEKDYRMVGIAELGFDVWLMSVEGILWKVNDKNRWFPGDVDLSLAVGNIKDMAFDKEGYLWIASEVITRYAIVEDIVEVFEEKHGFTSKNVSCIEVDTEGSAWIGTKDKGIYRIEGMSALAITCKVEQGLGCNDTENKGALKVEVEGGRPPYKYKWDNKACKGENPQGLGAGLYSVVVSDATGQSRTASAVIEDAKMELKAYMDKAESLPNASDGVASIDVKGGTAGYTYRWDNGETTITATKLSGGKHSVTVTDKMDCIASTTIEIPAGKEPEIPTLVISVKQSGDLNCATDKDGQIEISVEGGKEPYKYQWSNGLAGEDKIENIGAGKYMVTVSDAAGNQEVKTIEFEAPEPLIAKAVEDEPATRENDKDGVASVSVKGGAGDYSYLWDNGERSATASRLEMGDHTVTITDKNKCETTTSIFVDKRIIPALTVKTLSEGQTIRLDQLFFEADSTQVLTASEPMLKEVVRFLKKNPNVAIEVGGHTNNIPKHEYCDRLSSARAKAVADFLTDYGVDGSRVFYKGYGKRKPISDNRTAAGRKKNQRVEIKILSL